LAFEYDGAEWLQFVSKLKRGQRIGEVRGRGGGWRRSGGRRVAWQSGGKELRQKTQVGN